MDITGGFSDGPLMKSTDNTRELSEETKARIALEIANSAACRIRGMSVENLPVNRVYGDSDSRESLLRGALGFNGGVH